VGWRRDRELQLTARITDAVMSVVRSRGFGAARVHEDILPAADVTEGTFYNYFQGKEGVLDHFLRECGERWCAELSQSDPDGLTAVERCQWMAEIAVRIGGIDHPLLACTPLAARPASIPLAPRSARPYEPSETRRLVAEALAADQRRGRLRSDVDPWLLADILLAMLALPFLLTWIEGETGSAAQPERMRSVLAVFLEGALPACRSAAP
jgi:AcrR family transcriptional regulator